LAEDIKNNIDSYPSPLTDPREKGYKWLLAYSKAAWSNGKAYTPSNMFYWGRKRLNEIRTYALGKQSISKYRKILLGDEVTDKSWLNIDWTAPSFITKFREIAVSKLLQKDFDVECFAVDPLAKTEEDEYRNQMTVKILMRQMAEQSGSELAKSPELQPGVNEPQDIEQLEMQMKYGYKHQRAMEGELGVSLIQQQNNIKELRKRVVENLFDFGLGGYKEWIDEKGMVKVREIVPENIITSYCTKNNFSDMVHCGEIIYVSITDLVPYFNEDQIKLIIKSVSGKYGNPSNMPMNNSQAASWDKYKVAVFDLELITWDTTVYKKEIDGRGNLRTVKSDFQNVGRQDTIELSKGQAEPKYIESTKKVVYKCKWLVGTDMMYDYNKSENQKRKMSSWWDTSLSYHLYAWNFYNMQFTGITERLIPLEDKASLLWFKLQNLQNRLIPYLINIDLNVLENTSFGKGGAKWKPEEVVDFVFNSFIVPYRSTDLLSKNPNYKPMSIEATGQLAAFQQLREELLGTIDMMRQISGLNEATDGSTVNSRNQNSTNNAMLESTNNALYLIQNADRELMASLSDAIIQRIQIAVQLGKVEGYAKALGSDTVKFYQINPNISNYELGIFVRPAPAYEERQMLIQDLNLKDSQGLIDPSDKILVMSCQNLKQAAELLAYRVEKRKQQQHQQALQVQQQAIEGNMQNLQQAEQMKQQTAMMLHQLEVERINIQSEWLYKIEAMKKSADLESAGMQGQAKVVSGQIQSQAKILSSHIAAEASKSKQAMA